MDPYDKARELAQVIRESNEMKTLLQAWDNVEKNPASRDRLETFRNQQMELQNRQMMGEVVSDEEMSAFNQSMETIMQTEEIRLYLEAENQMGILMGEINRILSEPLEVLYRDRSS